MARATLKGVTRLDTKGWKRGMRDIKRSIATFKREVAVPFADAANNLARVARNAIIASAVISGMGTREAFKFESLETQFEMLYRNTRKAKEHVKDMADLSAVTPFDVEPFIQASRLLQTMGGEVLNNKNFITQVGDAAAMAGQDIAQVAEWTGRLYNDLKANIGTGRGGRMLMVTGIIKPETLQKLQEMTKNGASLKERWALVSTELDRAKGSMLRLSRTGNGLLSTMRGLVKLGAAKTFKAFGDQIKNVVFKINSVLNDLYQKGTFEKWGQSIANVASRIINKIWQVVKAWQNLNSNTRSQIRNMALVAGALLVTWKAGILVPLMKSMYGATAFVLRNFSTIAKGGSMLAVAFAGYKLGNVLYDSLSGNGKSTMQKIVLWLEGFVRLFQRAYTQIIRLGFITGKEIFKALIGQGSIDSVKNALKNEMDGYTKIVEETRAKINSIDVYDKMVGKFSNYKFDPKDIMGGITDFIDMISGKKLSQSSYWGRVQSNFKKEFSFKKIFADLKNILEPKALTEFLKKFEEVKKLGLTFPKQPDLSPLTEQLKTKDALADIDKLNSKMSKVPIRGIYARIKSLKSSLSPAGAVSSAKDTKTKDSQQTNAINKSVSISEKIYNTLSQIYSEVIGINAGEGLSLWGK